VIPSSAKSGVPLSPDARILVLRLDSLGDCVLSTSLFIGLRQLFPRAHLTAAFSDATAPLFEACPLFDRVVTLPRGCCESWLAQLEPPYDAVICPRWDVDHWLVRRFALMVGAPIRIGFDRGPYRHDDPRDGWAGAYFTHMLRVPSTLHEVAKGHALLDFLGAAGVKPKPQLWLPAVAEAEAEDIIRRAEIDQFVALGVSAAWGRRIWPTENFLPVIDALREARPGLRFAVIGGADAESAGRQLEAARPQAVVDVTGRLPVTTTAALLARAALYVGMDSGPMHLAAAGGVPVVEISCHPKTSSPDHPNAPERFGPYGGRSRILRPERPLSPCTDGCTAVHEPHCIRQIAPAAVVEAALALL
jgi:heptosyltransferase-3